MHSLSDRWTFDPYLVSHNFIIQLFKDISLMMVSLIGDPDASLDHLQPAVDANKVLGAPDNLKVISNP